MKPRARDLGLPFPGTPGPFNAITDVGYFLGPVCITNTHGIGAVHHGATRWMIDTYATHFAGHARAMPLIAETYDGVLNDINAMHVTPDHTIAALRAATSGPVAEGSTGGNSSGDIFLAFSTPDAGIGGVGDRPARIEPRTS